jgi:hypothetical protein
MANDDHALGARVRWARLRIQILGSLMAAPADGRELNARIDDLAARSWRHPTTGESIRFAFKTIERWWYIARAVNDPLDALARKVPSRAGTHRKVAPALAQAIGTQHRDLSWLLASSARLIPPRRSRDRSRRANESRRRRSAPGRPAPGANECAGNRTRDEIAESSNNHAYLPDTDSGLHCETTRADGDSRHLASDSRQLVSSVARLSDAELERAIVQAVTAGAFDVAHVLADRLDARRREQCGDVVPLILSHCTRPR